MLYSKFHFENIVYKYTSQNRSFAGQKEVKPPPAPKNKKATHGNKSFKKPIQVSFPIPNLHPTARIPLTKPEPP